MNENNDFLGREPVGALLFKLSVPTVIAQLVNVLYNIVDRVYIGHMPEDGPLALTGVGVCLPIIMMVSAVAALISAGGAPRASIFLGKKDTRSAEAILGGCFTLQIVISLLLSLALVIWNRDLLLAFGASGNTIEYASSYMTIYALGTLFVQLTLGMNAFITAQGFTGVGMRTVMIGAVLNLILDPVFIFGLHMGVRGAALATIISQGVSAVWCIAFLSSRKTVIRLRREHMKILPGVVLPCIALGTATFIMQSSESIISVCFNSNLLRYGGDVAVGAMTICTSVMQFAMLPLQGIGQGAQPIISYNFGAREKKRVRKAFFLLLASSVLYAFVLWGLIQLMPQHFVGLFTSDVALAAYAANALRIYCAVMCLFGIQIACQMTFVATGNAICSIIVAIMRKFVLLLPLIYLMPKFIADQAKGVYMAEPAADVCAVTFTAILFAIQFRKALRKLEA